jgi:hypothetical protein
MSNKMSDEQINRIADAIAAKIGEPGGKQLLGCGSASNSMEFDCNATGSYACSPYRCGGAGWFRCPSSFTCATTFDCNTKFSCSGYYESF